MNAFLTALTVAGVLGFLGYLAKLHRERKRCARFRPIKVGDGDRIREFLIDGTGKGCGPAHELTTKDQPLQLYEFFRPLCDEIRQQMQGWEPFFSIQKGNLVYEVDPKRTWKQELLGGMNGAAGDQFLQVRRK